MQIESIIEVNCGQMVKEQQVGDNVLTGCKGRIGLELHIKTLTVVQKFEVCDVSVIIFGANWVRGKEAVEPQKGGKVRMDHRVLTRCSHTPRGRSKRKQKSN